MPTTLITENGTKAQELHSIYKRLEEIRVYLEKEIESKQNTIEEKEEEMEAEVGQGGGPGSGQPI